MIYRLITSQRVTKFGGTSSLVVELLARCGARCGRCRASQGRAWRHLFRTLVCAASHGWNILGISSVCECEDSIFRPCGTGNKERV